MKRHEFLLLDKKAQTKHIKECWELLKEVADDFLPNDIVQDALIILRPTLYGYRGRGALGYQKHDKFTEKFYSIGDELSELELFELLKAGRNEATDLIRKALKAAEPKARKWIQFDPARCVYVLIAIGPKAPKTWKGFRPT